MRFLQRCLLGATCALSIAPAVLAQDIQPPAISQDLDPPAHIAFVDGSATLDRENDSEPAAPGMPLVPGDRLRTERGRVEILFPDGTALDLDEFTSIELRSTSLLSVTQGRLQLIVTGAANPQDAVNFHVDTPVAGIDTHGPGEYRVSVLSGGAGLEAELAVIRGAGAITGDRGSMPLKTGERSAAFAGGMPSYPVYFNAARFDAFDRWVDARRDDRRGVQSAQYLPPDLRTYGGAFDRDGSWTYEQQYGYVWYPRVASDWRPYYDGYWASVPAYGWTWVGGARWHWPTHHYGRWGINGHRWYWIPDRRWSTAWVSWGAAPGYVSWCPLGINNRPVFGLSVSIGNPWNGWVVVPRDRFGVHHQPVHRWAVGPGAFGHRTPFVAQAVAPVAARSYSRRTGGTIVEGNRGARTANERRWPVQEGNVGRRDPSANRQGPAYGVAAARSPNAPGGGSLRTQPDRSGEPATQRFGTRTTSPYGTAVPRSPRSPNVPVAPGESRRIERATETAPTIGAIPRTGRRPNDSVFSPAYAPAPSGAPASPPSAPPPNESGGRTRERAQRVSPPRESAPPDAGSRPESSGSVGRAVPRGQARENAGPQGGEQQGGQTQAAQPRGSRRAR